MPRTIDSQGFRGTTDEERTATLKPARSQAELTRVRQGWIQITLGLLTASTGLLVFLKVYGIV